MRQFIELNFISFFYTKTAAKDRASVGKMTSSSLKVTYRSETKSVLVHDLQK
jgi:hypothetical protein